jgi:replication factor C subunit 3/5
LNASDERGIEVVRKTIKEFASTQNISFKGIKLVVLDEADSMTAAAQFSLRRIMEKYAKNTRFCLICNYVSKVIPALQSRCTRFKFRPIPMGEAKVRVREICDAENLDVSDEGIECIFKLSEGDMRKVVNMLQSIAISRGTKGGQVTAQQIDSSFIYNMTGNVHPDDIKLILETLLTADLSIGFGTIQSIKQEKGIAISGLLKELTLKLMNIDMAPVMKKFLIKRMAELEYRCSLTCNEKIMLGSLVGAFVEARSVKNLNALN